METAADGTPQAYYVYGGGLLYKVMPDGTSYFFHYDGIGSTVAITDAGDNMVNRYAYSPYGQVLGQVEGIENRYQYVGSLGVTEEGDNLLYMRARYYDAKLGRFVSEDMAGFQGSNVTLYAYASNNPIMFIDPTGLVDWWAVGGGVTEVLSGIGLVMVTSASTGTGIGVLTVPLGISTGSALFSHGISRIAIGVMDEDIGIPSPTIPVLSTLVLSGDPGLAEFTSFIENTLYTGGSVLSALGKGSTILERVTAIAGLAGLYEQAHNHFAFTSFHRESSKPY